jgi:tRNA threonylcarbamoyladenosine biosynthesis protein TsaE
MSQPSYKSHFTLDNSTAFITHSGEETIDLGRRLSSHLSEGAILCFGGDLAAGKTTFIKGIIQARTKCDIREINSPTFTYLNIYDGANPVYHFDLYRLKDERDFLSMGFDDYFDARGICCIEWFDRITSILPRRALFIEIDLIGGNQRKITFSNLYEQA